MVLLRGGLEFQTVMFALGERLKSIEAGPPACFASAIELHVRVPASLTEG